MDTQLPSNVVPQRRDAFRRAAGKVAAALLGCTAGSARASLFAGETLDAVANGVAWAVLLIVPIVLIAVFWIVHVMPEKIAHKRHHPQTKAIQTLCLLSLVFGGLLWPLAWLWAYTRPIGYKMAYGTDKDEAYFLEMEPKVQAGDLNAAQLTELRDELDAMRRRGAMTAPLERIRAQIDERLAVAAYDEPPVLDTPVIGERRSA